MCWAATAANMLYYTNWNWSQTDIGYLGFRGAGYAGNWTDMNVRIETDTRISGSKFAIIA